MTGEAIRTRRCARPIALAIRCDSSGPWPGVNQARAGRPSSSSGRGSSRPVFSTSPFSQSSAKLAANAAASALERATTTTFSWSVQASWVQFVEPVQTLSPSRTTYLWCIRSGIPGIPRVGKGSDSIRSGRVLGGGGTAIGLWCSRL